MWTYLIRPGKLNIVKIGMAKDPYKRLADLQCGHYEELWLAGLIPGYYHVERAMHREFRKFHIRGEWYREADEILHTMFDFDTRSILPVIYPLTYQKMRSMRGVKEWIEEDRGDK